jgi:hypothetical protein
MHSLEVNLLLKLPGLRQLLGMSPLRFQIARFAAIIRNVTFKVATIRNVHILPNGTERQNHSAKEVHDSWHNNE